MQSAGHNATCLHGYVPYKLASYIYTRVYINEDASFSGVGTGGRGGPLIIATVKLAGELLQI